MASLFEEGFLGGLSGAAREAVPYIQHFATFPKLTPTDILGAVRSLGFHISNQSARLVIKQVRAQRAGTQYFDLVPPDQRPIPELLAPTGKPTLRNFQYRVQLQVRDTKTGQFAGTKWTTLNVDRPLSYNEAVDMASAVYQAGAQIYQRSVVGGLKVEAARNTLYGGP